MLTASDLVGLRAGTAEDLEAIKNDDWRDAVDVPDLRVHDGDLALDDDLDASGAALMVVGDLTVAGTVALDETGALIVTGRLRCRNLSCEGNLEIQGDAEVTETVFGSYEAGISWFHGALTAALLVEGNHAFEYDPARLQAGTHLAFTNFGGLRTGTAEQARAVLSDAAYAALANLMGLDAADGPAGGTIERLLREDGFLRTSDPR
jgi:hypothetical protein